MTALAPCGECNLGECDRCPMCRRFDLPPDRTGYATRNVVRVEAPEAEAMASWLEAIDWLNNVPPWLGRWESR